MDNTFSKLISRSQPKQQTTFGDPWEVVPIKNQKNARECIEIHLSSRGIQELKNFKDFPNIEVIWLNNNKIEKLENLDANFRVKHLYLQDNLLKTLEGSIKVMSYLETLLLYNNQLRDLDKNLSILREFKHLQTLDLFKNPLAEEPNYRLRIIYELPWLKLLDRHIITLEERREAKKVIEALKNYTFSTEEKKKKLKIPPSAQFSQAEKDLYIEAAHIKNQIRLRQQQKEEEERIANMPQTWKIAEKLPKTQEQIEMERRMAENPFGVITEFEKDQGPKKIFKKYDPKKEAKVPISSLENIYKDLLLDQGLIGKVPDMSLEEFQKAIQQDLTDFIPWDKFRTNLNKVYWKKPDEKLNKDRISQGYYKANTYINQGNIKQAKEELFLTIRLESKMLEDEKSRDLYKQVKVEENKIIRADTFDFGKFTFKKQFTDAAKYIL